MKRLAFILFVLCLFVFVPKAEAQIGSVDSDIDVAFYPENPTPNQMVDISLTSYVTDVNAANITWSVNGKVVKTGMGEKAFSVKVGEQNTTTRVDISIKTKEGDTITKSLSLKPVGIDLLWQSESYTPPFYKGKALFSFQNKITFIALPHMLNNSGVEISPKNLIYKWTKNGSVDSSASGFGKNTFTVASTIIARPLDVTVDVTSPNSSANGFAEINIAPTDPLVLFYAKSPAYGIDFGKTLSGTVELKDSKEMTVVAVPYFFGSTNPGQYLSYKWQINGKQIDADLSQIERVFRQVEGTSGTSNISVSVESLNKILQLAKTNFNLKFGGESSQ